MIDRSLIPPGAACEERVLELDAWRVTEGAAIARALHFSDFERAASFLRALAPHAEQLDHHPEVTIIGGAVVVRLTTHDVGGLTEFDFVLARRIDEIVRAHFPEARFDDPARVPR